MVSILSIAVTIFIYWIAKRIYRYRPVLLLSPLLVTPAVLVALLVLSHLSYAAYMTGGQWLADLLAPATVALAIPIYKNRSLLKQHAVAIISSIAVGSCIALVTSVVLAVWMHLGRELVKSLAPRSVTTPIAMEISRSIGGIPTMTAVFVMVTALIGIVAGPLLIRSLAIRNPIARGVLFGMGAHGAGTAKAFEVGYLEGTASSVAMVLAAGTTLLLIPILLPLLQRLL